MRVPGWLFLVGIVVVVGMTALLSLVAFSVSRQVAIDAGNVGIQIGVRCWFQPKPTVTPVSVATIAPTAPIATSESAVLSTQQPTETLDPAANYAYTDPVASISCFWVLTSAQG